MKTDTVLILGSAGRFGHAAVQAFAAAGWQVLAQARRESASLPSNVQHLGCALQDTDELVRRAAGASVVIHAVNPIYTEWRRQVLPLGGLGMDLAQRLGATFMLPGNIYNYGQQMPPLLSENTAENPTNEKGRIRQALEAEIAARAARVTSGLRAVVIRAGDFFGSGTGSWLDQAIVKSISRGRLVYPGPLDVAHAWAYLPDLARTFVAVAERRDGPALQRLHFAGHTLTGAELLDTIENVAAQLGLQPPGGFKRAAMPWAVIRIGGLVNPMWRELAKMAYLWRVPHELDGRLLASRVGPLATTPIALALRQSLLDLGLGDATRREAGAGLRYG